jgi:hypothetical protein
MKIHRRTHTDTRSISPVGRDEIPAMKEEPFQIAPSNFRFHLQNSLFGIF